MGMGQYFNTFMPYSMPQFTANGNFPLMTSFTPLSSASEDTEEKRKQSEADKKAADFMARLQALQQQTENMSKIKAQIKDMEEGKKELTDTINTAKKGKETEDGIIKIKETWEDYDSLPWWKKGLRGASHLVQGTWKLATGFFGYETNPKTGESEWNWKRCLKNAAIAAGCIALTAVPVVGPVVSTALLGTGVVCGAIGTGKGVIKAMNAKTPEELDYAYQDIGAGLTIGVSSALGLRNLGKGLQASSATNGAGGIVRSTSENAISQFVKDTTVNAYRATVQGVKTDQAAIAANGFWKTYGLNIKGVVPKNGKSKFETAKNNTTQNINNRLNEISQELNNPATTPIQKSLLHQEQRVLKAQQRELLNTVTKDGWKSLKAGSKVQKNAADIKSAMKKLQTNGSININGKTYNMNGENLSALQEALSRSQKFSKDIENLAKVRSATIKKMAFMKKYKAEVEAYTGTASKTRIGRLYDVSKISKSDITWKKALMSPLKALWEITMIPFKPWNYVQNSSTSTFYKMEETFVPMYEEGFLTTGFLGEALGMGDKVMTTTVCTKDENGNDTEEVVPVTKETIKQMEEQIKQYEDAISKAQSEINKMYIV